MISVADAKKIILENITAMPPVLLPLQEAVAKVLAEDIYATTDIPAFPQSSMDGYAFLFKEWETKNTLPVEGEIPAGSDVRIALTPGKAVRIFTGAPVPPGADTVVMQEKVKLTSNPGSGSELIIEDAIVKPGANVRPPGSEIKAGELALETGTCLSPAAVGFLAGIGTGEVKVFPAPSVTIIVTGNELQRPGQPLRYGQVYESNSFALKAALEQLNIKTVSIVYAADDTQILQVALGHALEQSDMIILTGGVSVGDYDFVSDAAAQCGVWKMFHKVKQRPGKPLYFGMKGKKPVFGLPGNPSSVLTCFYEYVMPAVGILCNTKCSITRKKVPLVNPFQKPAGLTHFLKGFYDGQAVQYLEAQESYRLRSFAKANCLVQIDEDVTDVKDGEIVEIHILP